MNFLFKKFVVYSLITCLLMYSFMLLLGPAQSASAADEYDLLRDRWKTYLTGGSAINVSDPEIAVKIDQIETNANSYWLSMNKTAGRTYLWNDLAGWSASSTISSNYVRLKEMALAYATTGSSLYGNTSLAADILSGLDWMYANKYNETKGESGNWWDWEIGVPLNLTDAMVLIYDQMSATQTTNYTKALDKFVPDPTYRTNSPSLKETGANRLDKALIVSLRGVVTKSSTKLAQGRDAISQVLLYVKDGDGFYEDGSFIQHDYVAYTGSYGAVLIGDMAKLMYLLGGSSWNVTDPNLANVIRWVTEAYQPFLYKGAMMDTVRGRAIARETQQDHQMGRGIISSLVLLADGMNAQDAATIRQIAKGQIASDTTFASYTEGLSIFNIGKIKALINDSSVVPAAELLETHVFAGMDRALHLRPNFGLALGLFSTRISAFEYGTPGENKKPWWQGAGAAYLYNSDQTQFNGAYWPTVNAVRLPGTTTDGSTGTLSSFKFNTSNWAGGSSVDGPYGSVGMQFSMSSNTGTPLSGKKSWFLFGDTYIALGSDITSTGGRTVETIVENRKLNAGGTNTLTVDGIAKPSTIGWSEAMTGAQWAHLAGSVPGSDIAYVFPGGATVNGLRETRTGSWNDIYTGTSTNVLTADYASLSLNHGVNPTQASYAYAVLPGKTAAEAAAYASNPGFNVLKNTGTVQAVKDTEANAVGANFWTDSAQTIQVDGNDYLTSNKKASVTVVESGNELQIGISDPTQSNTGTIEIELHRATTGVIGLDSGITVKQFAPTTKLEVKAGGSIGKTFLAKLNIGQPTTSAAPQLIEVTKGDGSATLKWSGYTGAAGYRVYYGTTAGSYTNSVDVSAVSAGETSYTVTGLTNKATYYFIVKAVNGSGESAPSGELSITLPDMVSFAPTADTYVRNGSYANTNNGTDPSLVVKNDGTGFNRQSFLKFDLSSFTGLIKSAKIRLVPTSIGKSGISQQANIATNDSWSETGMTWNNQPGVGTLLANWTAPTVGTPVEFDVTGAVYDAISTDKTFSIRIMATTNQGSTGDVIYASKENATANYRPVLIIEKPTYIPAATIDNAPAGWVNHDVTVTLTPGDGGSGVAGTFYTVNGGIEQQGTSVTITTEGSHTISYWSVDKEGNVESPHTAVVQLDKMAPTLNVILDKTALWLANHQMNTVNASVYANDNLSGIASVLLASITSSESDNGPGDGHTSTDIQGAEIGMLDTEYMLRAERSGKGNGRIYTITYTAFDQAGNITSASATVTVPHDQSGKL
ncbi:polysaccharide lyase family 8 super-sandwich domain-containing protein [Paenibacillus sp. V4I7]|uniref:polysaccharide lyase family 8 super-sandwich domain-containing protein n=1 Tax=Paenibacillus sp. V4I7 TaxID=3042307 RepID=UPI0027875BC6|nr:polysaccharide lyase family 8 super-sandwich domain-containing protein [Paenibacillus sp. V4I7]MDQ0900653.1 hyaluronate lyase [Paenibacillus sp. V4I7]